MKPGGVNVLISSGGRRNYLVRWFREALELTGIPGRVIVCDANPYAPALAEADVSVVMPPFIDESYPATMRTVFERYDVDLAFSLNDFELSLWGTAPSLTRGRVVGVPLEAQRLLEDKASYPALVEGTKLRTPRVCTGTEALASTTPVSAWGEQLIVKNRFGSGSSGLKLVRADDLEREILPLAASAADRNGQVTGSIEEGLDRLVVQEFIHGTEFGLDVVNDFNAHHQGVLVRQKLRMRSGETDQAVTADPAPFAPMGATLSEILAHTGLIDVDVIQSDDSVWLIDVNPRFGGGYPFSHLAGADVPACYLRWQVGRRHEPAWLTPAASVTSSKYEEVVLAVPGRR